MFTNFVIFFLSKLKLSIKRFKYPTSAMFSGASSVQQCVSSKFCSLKLLRFLISFSIRTKQLVRILSALFYLILLNGNFEAKIFLQKD